MTSNHANQPAHDDVDAFVSATVHYLDGQASDEQLALVNAQIKQSAACRRLFVELCYYARLMGEAMGERLHEQGHADGDEGGTVHMTPPRSTGLEVDPSGSSSLVHDLLWEQQIREGLRNSATAEPPPITPPTGGSSIDGQAPRKQAGPGTARRWKGGPLAWAAVFALAAGLLVLLMQGLGQSDTTAKQATLEQHMNAQWQDASGMPVVLHEGKAIEAGELELVTGFARLEMPNGTQVLLEAPVAIELYERADGLSLQRGQLVARAGQGTRSFTVSTPTASVTDLGTEFGVRVDEHGGTETFVFEGRVELFEFGRDSENGPRVQRRQLRQGQGWRVDAQGSASIDPSPRQADGFVRQMPATPYHALVRQGRATLHWQFDALEDGRVPNILGEAYAGSLEGRASVVDGAMRLRGDAHLHADELAESLSGTPTYAVEMMVRPERLQHATLFMLFVDEDAPSRRAGMLLELGDSAGLRGEELGGCVRFAHRSPPSALHTDGYELLSRQRYTAGEWLHLVAVNDGQRLVLYVNGQQADSVDATTPMADEMNALRVGAFGMNRRYFHGDVAALAVYPHALTAQQVESHHHQLQKDMEP